MAETKERVSSAREAMETLMEISQLLNTGLDAETLAICVKLCESGVNPEALALVIQELRKETAALQPEYDSNDSVSIKTAAGEVRL